MHPYIRVAILGLLGASACSADGLEGQGEVLPPGLEDSGTPPAPVVDVGPARDDEGVPMRADMVPLTRAELEGLLERYNAESVAVAPVRKKAGSTFDSTFASGTAVSTLLANWASYICYMNGIGGRFKADGSPYFRVSAPEANGDIYAVKQAPGHAFVRCVPRTAFTTPGGFQPHINAPHNYNFIWDTNPAIGCGQRKTWSTGLGGDWAAMVGGFGYDFNHTSDKFAVEQSNSVNSASQAWLEQTASPCRGVGFVNAVRLKGNGTAAKFRGPNGVGTAAAAGEWYREVAAGQSFTVDTAISANTHSCYFTFLAGNFSSDNDRVYLLPNGGTWRLIIAATANGGVRAKYRCIPHNQM